MRVFSFRVLFTLIFSITLGAFGVYIADQLPNMPGFWGIPNGRDLTNSQMPYYFAAMSGLMCVLFGGWTGPKIANVIVQAGFSLERMSAAEKISVGVGVFLGVLVTLAFLQILTQLPILIGFRLALSFLFGVIFIYLGIVAMMSMKTELSNILTRPAPLAAATDESDPKANCKILDTNVIIDGRVADVCRAGFIEGPLYVPGTFVLEELQHIADSSDGLKRARGRRGLDILNAMQKELPLIVRSWDKALDRSAMDDEVDTRLVKLAKALNGTIVTNDFNLNKVAALQGVKVLNVNELANALKPVVLPGEIMKVGIVKEGKEQNQGVAYLDDGTMIVVEDGRRYINETLHVVVTSVLQTVAGKMIFAKVRTDEDGDSFDYGGGGGQGAHDPGGNGSGAGHGTGGGGFTRRGPGRKVR